MLWELVYRPDDDDVILGWIAYEMLAHKPSPLLQELIKERYFGVPLPEEAWMWK